MRITKKLAVVATSAVAAVAVAGGAFAYVVSGGSGSGTATTTAGTAVITLQANAAITDLETPATIAVTGQSTIKNRHINKLTVAVDTTPGGLPVGCDPTWFTISNAGVSTAGHTFTTTASEPVDSSLSITLTEQPVDQGACVGASIPLTVTATA